MTAISHLDMFYETRGSTYVSASDPSSSPNTELNSTPTAAEIRFADGPNRFIDAEEFEAPDGNGFEVARFLIQRAMMDADAVVVPT